MSQQGQPQQQQIQVGNQIYFGQDFYIYTASFGTIAPNLTSQQNIQIQSDSDFEWIEATCFGSFNGAAGAIPENIALPVNITLVNSGSSRQLFNAPVPLTSFAGVGKQAFILPVSRLFKAYSNLQVAASSFDGVNTYNNVSLNFIGRKLFLTNNR